MELSANIADESIDVINVYNVIQKILCKRVYYFVNVYLTKNHVSETKQNYDGYSAISATSYSALRSNRSLIEFIGSRC